MRNVASSKLPYPEQTQIKEGILGPSFVHNKRHQGDGKDDQEETNGALLRHSIGGKGEGEEKRCDRGGYGYEPAPIYRASHLHLGNLPEPLAGPESSKNPYGNVDVEEGPPIQDSEQHSAQGQAEHGAQPESTLI
ncbi:MAG: hypothetical protein APZ16_03580 [Candidatus Hadarchaeum yellowstonense]|uniref:Uncharacterized protein n=1 Tax=Hadarchaeum yellowstonense TaxID=1776334 RepID=A0A147JZI7_HADYE|nr:MAG: hypothetical protein APZ16_03580 [Candidatus Hadarchaeum yellowstonense]